MWPAFNFELFHYYKYELANPSCVEDYHFAKHDNEPLLPKQDEPANYSHFGLSFYYQLFCKSMTFIETKEAAIKLFAIGQMLKKEISYF